MKANTTNECDFIVRMLFKDIYLTLLFLIFIIDIYLPVYHCFMCLYGCGLSAFIKLAYDLI